MPRINRSPDSSWIVATCFAVKHSGAIGNDLSTETPEPDFLGRADDQEGQRREHIEIASARSFSLIRWDAQMIGDKESQSKPACSAIRAQARIVVRLDCGPMLRMAIANFIA